MKINSLICYHFTDSINKRQTGLSNFGLLRTLVGIVTCLSVSLLPLQYASGQEQMSNKVFDMVDEELTEGASEESKVFSAKNSDLDREGSESEVSGDDDPSKTNEPDNRTTAEKLEDLKEEVLAVNRDLFILEEDLLFPASTQLAAYFSVDIGYFFSLDNIKVKIDDKQVTHFLYTQKDVDALYRGAIQKVYLGNVSTGEHEIVAILIGHGPHKREYRVAVSAKFEKSTEAKALEIQLRDNTGKLQPKLNVVEW